MFKKTDVEWYIQPSKTLQISRQWPYQGIRREIQNRFYLKQVYIMVHVFRLLLRICDCFNDRVFGWNQPWPLDDSIFLRLYWGSGGWFFERCGPKIRSNLRRCDFRTLIYISLTVLRARSFKVRSLINWSKFLPTEARLFWEIFSKIQVLENNSSLDV